MTYVRSSSMVIAIICASVALSYAPGSPAVAESAPASSAGSASAAAWTPPPGYDFEATFVGGATPCERAGQAGVGGGRWNAYVCHETLRKLTDLLFLYGDLYVSG
ncbi:hypothetical protein ACOZ38_38175 [Sphaerisporangium viridialbum]|uniref:hypothetical protein n=1 Tax=Sphaerisporangium viridialbum TaxID=46189 RepID=UPI003C74A74B